MCPADEAMDSSNTRTDEDEKPRREALETEVDPYKNLFGSDSDEEEEEGDVSKPQEVSNDLDRQQEHL
ncbi:hypothetical protein PC116_g26865 [Phytophthora cactorum]|nr:hypothetical protein Pcac1_g6409 [Phytophthora cactorum]KAG2821343.1 hypothetical protein PC113_g22491 [Phytophthora cactorum]KAG4224692.1 hypothetical protein PC116_g26865 [Phytophthora cactorum]